MKYIIDRFEGKYAICQNIETEENIDINISSLPNNIKEGDIIVNKNNTFLIDKKATNERTKKIKNKFNLLKNKR